MSLASLARHMKKDGRQNKIAVVIGTITNDLRLFEVPKITVSVNQRLIPIHDIFRYLLVSSKILTGLSFVRFMKETSGKKIYGSYEYVISLFQVIIQVAAKFLYAELLFNS